MGLLPTKVLLLLLVGTLSISGTYKLLFQSQDNVCKAVNVLRDAGYTVIPHPSSSSDTTTDCLSSLRRLQEAKETESTKEYFTNLIGALVCVSVAAMAAGLTLGLLGLDPLVLLIKERAAEDEQEKVYARNLLPVVQQHHRLLVTLLLMNAVANEALPIFLEKIVPPAFAVLVSVTLVLFFGEIIPSAIFTGPAQLQIANFLLPLVRLVMFCLYPIAGPIAKLLDYLLHGGEDDNHSANYTRSELSALIRIQYEKRVTAKGTRKANVGALDFGLKQTVRAHQQAPSAAEAAFLEQSHTQSIHRDEVTMVEGALQMKTKIALDVFTPFRRVFVIPSDLELTESNMVRIYAAGFTRIPVHAPGHPRHIIGILNIKLLIVVNPQRGRRVDTLPLRTPLCVAPTIPLVDLLNILQSGGTARRGGHLALVCARPRVANAALARDDAWIPEEAGLMGVITLEDVLEMLLQEQIYDEMDKREREAHRLAQLVVQRWRAYVRRRKAGQLTMAEVVDQAMARQDQLEANETTALLV